MKNRHEQQCNIGDDNDDGSKTGDDDGHDRDDDYMLQDLLLNYCCYY